MYIIFIEDNCVSEEIVCHVLNIMGLNAGRNHFISGEPKSLITEGFVQEGYVLYRQVSDSHTSSHEFLWGPRVYAGTTKMKVLEFFASITGTNPRAYPFRYSEALRDKRT